MAADFGIKISLTIRSETDLYRFEHHPKKSAEWHAMLDTVITISISALLSILVIRLAVQMWLDTACDRYSTLPKWLLRFANRM